VRPALKYFTFVADIVVSQIHEFSSLRLDEQLPRPRPTSRIASEEGQALVEFALCLSILTLVFAGIVDYDLMIQQAMQIGEAASAGAQYGAIPGNEKDLSGMQTAATNAAPGVSGLNVTASDVFICPPWGVVSSSTICLGYGTPLEYVQVQTSATVSPLLHWAGISSSSITSTVLFRVPWTP
jgi:hypothetical protein